MLVNATGLYAFHSCSSRSSLQRVLRPHRAPGVPRVKLARLGGTVKSASARADGGHGKASPAPAWAGGDDEAAQWQSPWLSGPPVRPTGLQETPAAARAAGGPAAKSR